MDKPAVATASKEQSRDGTNAELHGTANARENEEGTHLTGLPLYALILSMLLLVLIVTIDISILATAIPRITDEFHTIADIGWYGSAFLLAQCAVQPLSGRIYSLFPFKHSFIAFFAVFELGSLLSGVAVSSNMLIIARAISGIGSAGLMSGAMTIVGVAAPPEKRSVVLGFLMSLASAGQLVGPLIGGALTQHVTWRWCFYVNLPVGAVTMALFIFIKLPNTGVLWKSRTWGGLLMELDILGFAQFTPACVMLLLALQWGGNEYAWRSATVIGLICGSVPLFVIFVFWERRQGDDAMIPKSLMSVRTVYSSCITAGAQGGSMLILSYWLPIWFQVAKQKSPTSGAVATLPNFLSQIVTAVGAGIVVSRTGYVMPPMLIGNALVMTAFGLLSTLSASSDAGEWIGYQILSGCGRGMSIQMTILATQGSVAKTKIATVTAIVMWSQFFGGAVFIAVAQAVFVSLLRSSLHTYAPSLDASVVIGAGATGYVSVVPQQYRHSVLQAYDRAITSTFYLGLAVTACALIACMGVGMLKVDVKKVKEIAKVDSEKVEK